MKLAMVAPVTSVPAAPSGRPRSERIQPTATRSSVTAIGDIALTAAFWSQAAAIQLAPTATGSEPPVTKPK